MATKQNSEMRRYVRAASALCDKLMRLYRGEYFWDEGGLASPTDAFLRHWRRCQMAAARNWSVEWREWDCFCNKLADADTLLSAHRSILNDLPMQPANVYTPPHGLLYAIYESLRNLSDYFDEVSVQADGSVGVLSEDISDVVGGPACRLRIHLPGSDMHPKIEPVWLGEAGEPSPALRDGRLEGVQDHVWRRLFITNLCNLYNFFTSVTRMFLEEHARAMAIANRYAVDVQEMG